MAARNDRDNTRINEKHKNILANILSREENKFCADCLSKGPRWTSWNLGVLLCIRCSGLHRSMGVHISRVKSVNLDTWTKEQMMVFCSRGNGWAKEMYEAKLPKDFRRPQNDSSLEYFIRDKYEKKKYISPIEIPLRSLAGLGLIDNETQKKSRKLEKKDEKVSVVSLPFQRGLQMDSPVIPRPKSLPQLPKHESKLTQSEPQQQAPGPSADDLLGLKGSPVAKEVAVPVNVTAPSMSSNLGEDLFGPLSSFQSNSMSSSVSSPNLLNSAIDSESFVQDHVKEKLNNKKLSKDSILSLYSHGSQNSSLNTAGFMAQSSLTYQQQVRLNQQEYFHGAARGVYQQQPQIMTMPLQHQQQQFSAQRISQQMAGMKIGYGGMMLQAPQQPSNAGYGVMPQMMSQNMYGQLGQQQAHRKPSGCTVVSAATGVHVGAGHLTMPGAMLPSQNKSSDSMWGGIPSQTAAPSLPSGHTLSTQLWR